MSNSIPLAQFRRIVWSPTGSHITIKTDANGNKDLQVSRPTVGKKVVDLLTHLPGSDKLSYVKNFKEKKIAKNIEANKAFDDALTAEYGPKYVEAYSKHGNPEIPLTPRAVAITMFLAKQGNEQQKSLSPWSSNGYQLG
ncbi:hypothetical protein SK355_02475 [Candidatus Fukatsuia symbiotica]|uniref:Uncharacterized protein n=1 Tax=Candidatus Fukatsuia symbiotica TaxID=1878942 RepID=A0A2U8I645_9GAMM|nr:hypothetical protein [Candidatus Fukatsuia symbiotica]AWK13324.1 hypothetical protein CCS41_00555 [Candidatus Fukatsuia symbiotica]MEA9444201.1 hypothetical protein [Candidatus Fukatsuia symbiotica]